MPGRLGEGAHLGLREAEVGGELAPENAEDVDVVETRKQAFTCDPEDACEHPLEEMLVVFETTGKEVAEESDGVVVIPVGVAGMDGRVVFVDEDDDPFPVVLREQA